MKTAATTLAAALALFALGSTANADELVAMYGQQPGSACRPKKPTAPYSMDWFSVRNTGSTNEYFICPVEKHWVIDYGSCLENAQGQRYSCDGPGVVLRPLKSVQVFLKDTSRRTTTCFVGIAYNHSTQLEWHSDTVVWGQPTGAYNGTATILINAADNDPRSANVIVTCSLKPGQEIHGYLVEQEHRE